MFLLLFAPEWPPQALFFRGSVNVNSYFRKDVETKIENPCFYQCLAMSCFGNGAASAFFFSKIEAPLPIFGQFFRQSAGKITPKVRRLHSCGLRAVARRSLLDVVISN